MAISYTFNADLWIWRVRELDSWNFVTVPVEVSDELRERSGPRRGFGSLPVEVTIGNSTWKTSIFPDKKSGCYLLPVKAIIRKAESISAGENIKVTLKPL